jgi:hypothetical protein
MKDPNGRVKLSVKHHSKSLIGSKHLSSRVQEIDPCEAREVINEDHIIMMPPF